MKRFVMPWPYSALWPNSRPHWSGKAKATRSYRYAAKCLALGAEVGEIRVTFCPKPFGPFPDLDNCIAAFKSGQDGIADALGVNDRSLTVRHDFGDRCKDGAVIVLISPPARSEPATSTTQTEAPPICSPENGGDE